MKKYILVYFVMFCASYCKAGADVYEIQWADTIDNGAHDRAWGVAIDSCGNIIVTGLSYVQKTGCYFTVKYDSLGNILWTDTVRVAGGEARDVAIDRKENIVITGGNWVTLKYNSGGNILWIDTLDTISGAAWCVAVDSSGNIIVTGDYYIIKYNSTGNMVWVKPCNTSFRGVAVDRYSNIVAAGLYNMYGNVYAIRTTKYDSSGVIVWSDTIHIGYSRWAYDVAVDQEGNIVIVGSFRVTEFSWPVGYYVVKYDSSGNIIWVDTLNIGYGGVAVGVAIDMYGNIIVTGEVYINAQYDMDIYTVKYNSMGSILWADTIDIWGEDLGGGVAIGQDGSIVVAGSFIVPNTTNYDWYVVKYIPVSGVEEHFVNCGASLTKSIEIYPNPFITYTTIKETGISRDNPLLVSDLTGRIVEEIRGTEFGKKLSPGVYFIRAEGCKPVKAVKLR